MNNLIDQTFRDSLKQPVLPDEIKPNPLWRLVRYLSIYYPTTPKYGYLTSSGDVMIYLDWLIPLTEESKWRVASSKNEVAEILEYI